MTPLGIAGAEASVVVGSAPNGSAVIGNALDGNLVRFLPNGIRDTHFGADGLLAVGPTTAAEGVESLSFSSRAMAVDIRGRVLVFGDESDSSQTFNPGGFNGAVHASSAVVLRFNDEGKPDRTFGEGRGFVRSDFGLGSGLHTAFPMVAALAGQVDSQGRPVFVAGVTSATNGCYGKPGVGYQPRAIVRLTQSGRGDPAFGAGGVSPVRGTSTFPGLGVSSDDKPVASVGLKDECKSGTTIHRLRRGGRPLTGFGSNGVRAFKRLNLALVEPSGAMVLSGRRRRGLEVVRVLADGRRDAGFGRDGSARVHLPVDAGLHLRPTAVDREGRILLAGFNRSPDGSPAKGQPRRSSFVVARLLPDGELDRSFGNRGSIFTLFPRPLEVTSAQATLDPRGRLLVAGTVIKVHQRDGAFAVARYLLGP